MAYDTKLTRLNFNYQEASKSFVDKLTGLKIFVGHINGLRANFSSYQNFNNGFTIALQAQGMPQDELDIKCVSLAEEAGTEEIDLLVTKCDLPFDNRWFIAGDIAGLIELARQDKIHCPFSDFLYDDIIAELEKA